MTLDVKGKLVLLPDCWSNPLSKTQDIYGAAIWYENDRLQQRVTRVAISTINQEDWSVFLSGQQLRNKPAHKTPTDTQSGKKFEIVTYDDSNPKDFLCKIQAIFQKEKKTQNPTRTDIQITGVKISRETSEAELQNRLQLIWMVSGKWIQNPFYNSVTPEGANHYLQIQDSEYEIQPDILSKADSLIMKHLENLAKQYIRTNRDIRTNRESLQHFFKVKHIIRGSKYNHLLSNNHPSLIPLLSLLPVIAGLVLTIYFLQEESSMDFVP